MNLGPVARRAPAGVRLIGRHVVGAAEGRRGFTLVELAVVVMVVALLAALAMPNMQRAIFRARAAEAVGDLQVVRVAILNYLADNHTWPAEVGVGVIPPGLEDYLPEGYNMLKENYSLNYDNWTFTSNYSFIAVAVSVDDTIFGNYILDMLGTNAWTNGTYKFTWVVEWID
jgi:prepilin-type N-terminal cleavage/methylation domain-containing protein